MDGGGGGVKIMGSEELGGGRWGRGEGAWPIAGLQSGGGVVGGSGRCSLARLVGSLILIQNMSGKPLPET